MLIVQLLILSVILLIIPFFVGGIFSLVERGRGKRLFQWISGQLTIWVGVAAIAALLLMRQGDFGKAIVLFWFYIAAILCYACGAIIRQRIWLGKRVRQIPAKGKRTLWNVILWFLFAGVLVFQLVQVVLTYDAAMMSGDTGIFYIDNPFSLWIAFLAEVSGMSPIMVEQVVLPIVLLCMSYGVFYLLGARLFVKKRVYHALFLVLLSVVVIAGGYACHFYWPETWMNVRSKPEWVLLGGVLVPYLILLAVIIGSIIRKKKGGTLFSKDI